MNYCEYNDLKACHARLREGSRTFAAASLLLPRHVREPAAALYAFCRIADDAVDLGGGSGQTLAALRERLDRIYTGRGAALPEDRAFSLVVRQFGIPRVLPEALLEGFDWDIRNRCYETLDDLNAYAARVAGSVGAMMSIIMGVRAPSAIARACELGMAMQLTNIARDVGEDARAGRLYLPRQWLREAGIDPQAWLLDPGDSEALGQVVQRLLSAADGLYERADAGIPLLPRGCRFGIRSARLLYAGIGRQIERDGMAPVHRRAFVPAARKAALIWSALRPGACPDALRSLPVAVPARFLVEAVAASPASREVTSTVRPAAWWALNRRAARVVDLFDRLERREQAER